MIRILCVCSVVFDSWTGTLGRLTLGLAPRQAPLSMEFSRQEYWSELPFPTPGDLPNPGTKPVSPVSPASAGRFCTTEPPSQSPKYQHNAFEI